MVENADTKDTDPQGALDLGWDMGNDSFPMDFEMPDFQSMGMMLNLMAWLPAIMAGAMTFILSFIAHVIIVGLDFSEPFPWMSRYVMTFGYFMFMILLSLLIAGVVAAAVKMKGGKKSSTFPPA